MTDAQWKQLFGEERISRRVIVYNREDFEKNVRDVEDFPYGGLYALIEIYTGPKGKPVLDKEILDENQASIIALDFDDFPDDIIFPDSRYQPENPTITYEQAERLVKFIDWNQMIGRDFIVHCDAGVSRSQQVAEYIMKTCKHGIYEYDTEKSTHSRHFANTIVLSRLLEVRHKTIPSFRDKEGKFYYNRDMNKWLMKDTKVNLSTSLN